MADRNGWIHGRGEGGEKVSVCELAFLCVCVDIKAGGREYVFMTGEGLVAALLGQTAIRVIDTVFVCE